jgi:DNA replication regulator SLD3
MAMQPIRFVTSVRRSSYLCEQPFCLIFCVRSDFDSFAARLPEQCSAISRKLGGPLVVSPSRPKLAKPRSSSAVLSRPGAIAKRPVLSKSRGGLERILTDERQKRGGSRGPSGAISLMRSATAPAISGLKREGSETLMANIPPAETPSISVSRGWVLKSKKFSQREVDLSNLVNTSDTNTKKTNIEAELQEAISALKRPNRQLAGQLIVETAEKRALSGSLSSRSKLNLLQSNLLVLIHIQSQKSQFGMHHFKAYRYSQLQKEIAAKT